MKNATLVRSLALLAGMLALPTLAQAHTGHSLVYDCAAGLAHPLHGWDHLLAMIAVGVLAARYGGLARWLLPAAFLTVMGCAAGLGAGGFVLPGTETTIATSMLVLGVLIAATARLPLMATVIIVGLFGAAHGSAHGAEMPATSATFFYAVGFMLSTTLLHATGLLFGQIAGLKSTQLPRIAGAACAVAGAFLLIA